MADDINSVADLVATLRLDVQRFNQDLRQARADMRRAADEMASDMGKVNNAFNNTGSGGSSLVVRLTERFLIYQALRGVIRGVGESLAYTENITRQMDQTGFGSKAVQQLNYMAAEARVPVDTLTQAIAHLEAGIGGESKGVRKAVADLGLDFVKLKQTKPEYMMEAITTQLAKITDQDRLANDVQELFGARSTKLIEILQHYQEAKRKASEQKFLSDTDLANIDKVTSWWERTKLNTEATLAKMMATGAKAMKDASLENFLYNVTPFPVGPPPGNKNATDINIPAPSASKAPTPVPTYKTAEEQARERERALRQEWEAYRAEVALTSKVLNEFGADGKRNSVLMAEDFKQLVNEFHRGRISIEELKEATANYFSMVEENAAKPGLREAIKMFRAGVISADDLLNAREVARGAGKRSEVEDAFMRGDASVWQLLRANQDYSDVIQDYGRKVPPPTSRSFTPGWSDGSSSPSISAPPTKANINVIPMDQFSEMMLRRWQQQQGIR